jgi:uncharacterized membrane protein
MILRNSARFPRQRMAAIAAAVAFMMLALASAEPAWAAARSTESPTEAPPVVTLQAFLLDKGGFAPLDVPCVTQVGEAGQEPFELTDLNNRGQIVGFCTDASGTIRGSVLENGAFTTIEFRGAVATAALGINDRGQIVGSYSEVGGSALLSTLHGFLLDDGVFTRIDFPGASSTLPLGINNRGQIVGAYSDGAIGHGFLLRRDTFTTIDAPGAVLSIAALSINDRGQILVLTANSTETQ